MSESENCPKCQRPPIKTDLGLFQHEPDSVECKAAQWGQLNEAVDGMLPPEQDREEINMSEPVKCPKCGARAHSDGWRWECGNWKDTPEDETASCLRRQLATAGAEIAELKRCLDPAVVKAARSLDSMEVLTASRDKAEARVKELETELAKHEGSVSLRKLNIEVTK